MAEYPTRHIRIAVDCSVFAHTHGGLASFFRPLLLRMIEEYQTAHFFLVSPQSAAMEFLPRAANISLLPYNDTQPLCFGTGRFLRRPLNLSAMLRRAKADILLSPYYAFFIPLRYREASVIAVHDTCFWDMPQYFSIESKLLHKAFMAWNALWVREFLTVSETSKHRLLQHFPKIKPEKVTVVYNTWEEILPPTGGAPAPGSRLEHILRQAPQHLFLCSSGFSMGKNVATTLKALKLALAERGDLGLLLTGNARYEGELWRMLDALELHAHVFPTGVLSAAEMEWLSAERATASVCMSEYEGFGRSLVEAMRAGLPLLCSDISTNREIAGEYPLAYCGVHDAQALCRAMLAVAHKGKRKPAFDERFSFAYNWNIFSGKLNAVLRHVAETRGLE